MTDAQRKMVERYYPLMFSFIRKYPVPKIPGFNYEDYTQELSLSLVNAVITYDSTKAQFSTYLYTCLNTTRYTYLRKLRHDAPFYTRSDDDYTDLKIDAQAAKDGHAEIGDTGTALGSILARAIARMPHDQGELFREIVERSMLIGAIEAKKQIMAERGLPKQRISRVLQRGRAEVKKLMERDGYFD